MFSSTSECYDFLFGLILEQAPAHRACQRRRLVRRPAERPGEQPPTHTCMKHFGPLSPKRLGKARPIHWAALRANSLEDGPNLPLSSPEIESPPTPAAIR